MTDRRDPVIPRLDDASLDVAADRVARLREDFPEVFREGRVDFDALRRSLGEWVDPGKERFGLTWPGKAACMKAIQTPSVGTLVPDRAESVDFDATKNVVIEGDNLEVLKLLQKSYYGKVKMIYIDPPYNTGNEFIYPDNFQEGLQTYLRFSGQLDDSGSRLSTTLETSGRHHSKWLSMMYPRLYLARNLLRDDGLIFISIDDNEFDNLRSVMNDVFGEENFVDNIIWKKRYGGGPKEKYLVSLHEYILVFARNKEELGELFIPLTKESVERYYTGEDENLDSRGPFRTHPLEATKSMDPRPNLVFPIEAPDGSVVMPKRQWLWSRDRVERAIASNEIAFMKDRDGNWSVHSKQYLRDDTGQQRLGKPFSIIDNVYTQHGTNEMLDLFGDAKVFDFPKPSKLIENLVQIATAEDRSGIVIDFFAGSGATAQAVLQANKADGGSRKYILVQLPEPTEQPEYPTISAITRERIRRAGSRLRDRTSQLQLGSETGASDLGFRAYKLQPSTFQPWNGNVGADNTVTQQLEMSADTLRPDNGDESVLTEILLRAGYELTTPVEKLNLAGAEVFSVAGGDLLVSVASPITIETIEAMAAREPGQIVLLDAAFGGDDALKVNAMQTVRGRANTIVKVV